MPFAHPAFTAPAPLATRSRRASATSPVLPASVYTHAPQRRRADPIRCAAPVSKDAKGSKKKKSAPPPVFATDMKGNFVWSLRSATEGDVGDICELVGNFFPPSVVSSLVGDSDCCMVCEASVKGTKEGEGYHSHIMGVALVDVITEVRNKEAGFSSGFMKRAELLSAVVSDQLPDPPLVKKKIVLGAMKRLKERGVVGFSATVAADDTAKIDQLKQCLLRGQASGGRVVLSCNLTTENPDPQKKVL